MMNIDIWNILMVLFVGFLLGCFLPKYFGKKGENLATKEDISGITDRIESVKKDYAEQLASIKAELSAKLNRHGFRFEKEYEVLNELNTLLVDVRDASRSLRPILDSRDPSKNEDDIKKERLEYFFKAQRKLYLYRERKRPFYPKEIYESILSVEKTANIEANMYKNLDPKIFNEYWKTAEQNQQKIVSKAEDAMEIIRDRVTKWETLNSDS
jgi:hypothetical protein